MNKVSPKDPFKLSANTYNRWIELVGNKTQGSLNQKFVNQNRNIVQVINKSGIDLPIFSVVEYDSNYNPFMDEQQITYCISKVDVQDLVSDGVSQYLPHTFKKRVCILQEPIPINGVGKALIKGVAKVKIKKDGSIDVNKPMFVIKVKDDNDPDTTPDEHTYMKVTNKETPDELIAHDISYKFGVIHLGKFNLNPPPFVGILDCVADTGNTNKVVVKNYYSGRIYHIRGTNANTFRFLTIKPPRPRSVAVLAQYIYEFGGLSYVEIQPLFSSDMESIVKYNDAQTILNATVLGRRSYKDVIAYYDLFPADAMRYGEYPL